jgi:hypothetical protein
MITSEQAKEIRQRNDALMVWVDSIRGKNGWASYRPEDKPTNVPDVSNEERSALEVFEFCQNPPDKYFLYIREKERTATTWTGDVLGQVSSVGNGATVLVVAECLSPSEQSTDTTTTAPTSNPPETSRESGRAKRKPKQHERTTDEMLSMRSQSESASLAQRVGALVLRILSTRPATLQALVLCQVRRT